MKKSSHRSNAPGNRRHRKTLLLHLQNIRIQTRWGNITNSSNSLFVKVQKQLFQISLVRDYRTVWGILFFFHITHKLFHILLKFRYLRLYFYLPVHSASPFTFSDTFSENALKKQGGMILLDLSPLLIYVNIIGSNHSKINRYLSTKFVFFPLFYAHFNIWFFSYVNY